MKQISSHQSGSVFFIILFAIAMLAALSFIVMRNGGTSASTMSNDQAKLAATEIISHSDTIAAAVQKLRLRGCTETQLSAKHAVEFSWAGYTNASSPSDKSCWIYDVAGANAIPQKAPGSWFDSAVTADKYWAYTPEMAITGLGSTAPELVFALSGLKKEICIKINDNLGVGAKGANPVSVVYQDNPGFTGVYPGSAVVTIANATLNGKTSFCLQDSQDNVYKFLRIILVR